MLPSQYFQLAIINENYLENHAQSELLIGFDELYELCLYGKKRVSRKDDGEGAKGIYLYGGVGTGKTTLMKLFYDTLHPLNKKVYMHYFEFMKIVHSQLKKLHDVKNPLKKVAKFLSNSYQLICLDEFYVSDIADAMLLSDLFHYLLSEDMYFVFTSNTPPNRLYENGLQFERFSPMIGLIQSNFKIYALEGEDYRYRIKQGLGLFELSLLQITRATKELFISLSKSEVDLSNASGKFLIGSSREIPYLAKFSQKVIWFDFKALFESPVGYADFVGLVESFRYILVSNVPMLTQANENSAHRLMTLIDLAYINSTSIYVSSEVSLADLYVGDLLVNAFPRVKSRLNEFNQELLSMESNDLL